jgi:glycosyltransferase involved in cell wall biosynthesis
MPAFNEEAWIEKIVRKVLRQPVEGVDNREVIIVDDGSTDRTREIIAGLAREHPETVRPFYHPDNRGKGAALRTAITRMTGDLCIIQDADWEYDPADYGLMLEPIIDGRADCVYGSRFTGSQAKRVLFFWHYAGNKFVTLLCNMVTNLNLTDMETCYKAFHSEVLKSLPLRARGFDIEPEITVKIAKRKYRVYEVGISYSGRTYEEGKKITWVDGLKAVCDIIKFRFTRD